MAQVRYQRLCPLLVLTMSAVFFRMVASMQDAEVDSKDIHNVGKAIRKAAEAVRKARSDIHEAERAIEKSVMIPVHILILSSPVVFLYLINQPDATHIVHWMQETARSIQTVIRDMFVEYHSRQQPLPNPTVQASPLGFTTYPAVSSAPRTDAEGWEIHEHLLQPRRSGRLSSLRRHFFIEDTENDNSCVVCLDRPANMTLRPCGHRCVCRRCALRILNPRVGEDGGKCPLDRQPILVAVPDRICVIS
ncbi:hypothetical protein Bbelb_208460 [Branchiostoma belcheri]|nr:hypothetical protein Bbelb_208460 [Branchiostoma belcheri]